ncbi:hypothetical protein [Dactylosporangium darangshiense]|uniref:hypothetical protein n=1 Tax=Dactylosporangium darangshiense TaxID=579108 RepID=UPI0031E92F9D
MAEQLRVPGDVVAIAGAMPYSESEDVLLASAALLELAAVGDPDDRVVIVDRLDRDRHREIVHELAAKGPAQTLVVLVYDAEFSHARAYARAFAAHIVDVAVVGLPAPRGVVVSARRPFRGLGRSDSPVWFVAGADGVAVPEPFDDLAAAIARAGRSPLPPFDLARELRVRLAGGATRFGLTQRRLADLAGRAMFAGSEFTAEFPDQDGRVALVPVGDVQDAAQRMYRVRRWLRLGMVREMPADDAVRVAVQIPSEVRAGALHLAPSGAGAALDVLALPLVRREGHELGVWLNGYRDGIRGFLLPADDVYLLHAAVPPDAGDRVLIEVGQVNRKQHGTHQPGSVIQEETSGTWMTADEYADMVLPRSGGGGPRIVVLWQQRVGHDDLTVFHRELARNAIVVVKRRNDQGTFWEATSHVPGVPSMVRLRDLRSLLVHVTGGQRPGVWSGTDTEAVVEAAQLVEGPPFPLPAAGSAAVLRRLFEDAQPPSSDDERSVPIPILIPPGADTAGHVSRWLAGQDVVAIRNIPAAAAWMRVPGRYVRDIQVQQGSHVVVYHLVDASALGSDRVQVSSIIGTRGSVRLTVQAPPVDVLPDYSADVLPDYSRVPAGPPAYLSPPAYLPVQAGGVRSLPYVHLSSSPAGAPVPAVPGSVQFRADAGPAGLDPADGVGPHAGPSTVPGPARTRAGADVVARVPVRHRPVGADLPSVMTLVPVARHPDGTRLFRLYGADGEPLLVPEVYAPSGVSLRRIDGSVPFYRLYGSRDGARRSGLKLTHATVQLLRRAGWSVLPTAGLPGLVSPDRRREPYRAADDAIPAGDLPELPSPEEVDSVLGKLPQERYDWLMPEAARLYRGGVGQALSLDHSPSESSFGLRATAFALLRHGEAEAARVAAWLVQALAVGSPGQPGHPGQVRTRGGAQHEPARTSVSSSSEGPGPSGPPATNPVAEVVDAGGAAAPRSRSFGLAAERDPSVTVRPGARAGRAGDGGGRGRGVGGGAVVAAAGGSGSAAPGTGPVQSSSAAAHAQLRAQMPSEDAQGPVDFLQPADFRAHTTDPRVTHMRSRSHVTELDRLLESYARIPEREFAHRAEALQQLLDRARAFRQSTGNTWRRGGVDGLIEQGAFEAELYHTLAEAERATEADRFQLLLTVQDRLENHLPAQYGSVRRVARTNVPEMLLQVANEMGNHLADGRFQSLVLHYIDMLADLRSDTNLPSITRNVLNEIVALRDDFHFEPFGSVGTLLTDRSKPNAPAKEFTLRPLMNGYGGTAGMLGHLAHELTHAAAHRAYRNTPAMLLFDRRATPERVSAIANARIATLRRLDHLLAAHQDAFTAVQHVMLRSRLDYGSRPLQVDRYAANLLAAKRIDQATRNQMRVWDQAAGENSGVLVEYDTVLHQILVYLHVWRIPQKNPFYQSAIDAAQDAFHARETALVGGDRPAAEAGVVSAAAAGDSSRGAQAPAGPYATARGGAPEMVPALPPDRVLRLPDGRSFAIGAVPVDGNCFFHALRESLGATDLGLPGEAGDGVAGLRARFARELEDWHDAPVGLNPDDVVTREDLSALGVSPTEVGFPAGVERVKLGSLPLLELSPQQQRNLLAAWIRIDQNWSDGAGDLVPALAARVTGKSVTVVSSGVVHQFPGSVPGSGEVVLHHAGNHYSPTVQLPVQFSSSAVAEPVRDAGSDIGDAGSMHAPEPAHPAGADRVPGGISPAAVLLDPPTSTRPAMSGVRPLPHVHIPLDDQGGSQSTSSVAPPPLGIAPAGTGPVFGGLSGGRVAAIGLVEKRVRQQAPQHFAGEAAAGSVDPVVREAVDGLWAWRPGVGDCVLRVDAVLTALRVPGRGSDDGTAVSAGTVAARLSGGRFVPAAIADLAGLPGGTLTVVWVQHRNDPQHVVLVHRPGLDKGGRLVLIETQTGGEDHAQRYTLFDPRRGVEGLPGVLQGQVLLPVDERRRLLHVDAVAKKVSAGAPVSDTTLSAALTDPAGSARPGGRVPVRRKRPAEEAPAAEELRPGKRLRSGKRRRADSAAGAAGAARSVVFGRDPDPMFTVPADGYCQLYAFIATDPALVFEVLGQVLSPPLREFLSDPGRVRSDVTRMVASTVPDDSALAEVTELLRERVGSYLDANAGQLPADVTSQRIHFFEEYRRRMDELSDREVLALAHLSGHDVGPDVQSVRDALTAELTASGHPLDHRELGMVRDTVANWSNRWSSPAGEFLAPLLAHATGSRITILRATADGVHPLLTYGPDTGRPVTLYHTAADPQYPNVYNHYNAAVPVPTQPHDGPGVQQPAPTDIPDLPLDVAGWRPRPDGKPPLNLRAYLEANLERLKLTADALDRSSRGQLLNPVKEYVHAWVRSMRTATKPGTNIRYTGKDVVDLSGGLAGKNTVVNLWAEVVGRAKRGAAPEVAVPPEVTEWRPSTDAEEPDNNLKKYLEANLETLRLTKYALTTDGRGRLPEPARTYVRSWALSMRTATKPGTNIRYTGKDVADLSGGLVVQATVNSWWPKAAPGLQSVPRAVTEWRPSTDAEEPDNNLKKYLKANLETLGLLEDNALTTNRSGQLPEPARTYVQSWVLSMRTATKPGTNIRYTGKDVAKLSGYLVADVTVGRWWQKAAPGLQSVPRAVTEWRPSTDAEEPDNNLRKYLETHLETLGLKKDALPANGRGQLLEPARTYVQSWVRSMRTATKPGTDIRYTDKDVAKMSGKLVEPTTVTSWWQKAASELLEVPRAVTEWRPSTDAEEPDNNLRKYLETHLETLGLKKDALAANGSGQLPDPVRTYVRSWVRSMRTATKPGTNIRYNADDVAKLSGYLVQYTTVYSWWPKAAPGLQSVPRAVTEWRPSTDAEEPDNNLRKYLETLELEENALAANGRGQLLEPARTYVQSWVRSMRTATKPGTDIRYTAEDVATLSGNLVTETTVNNWWPKAAPGLQSVPRAVTEWRPSTDAEDPDNNLRKYLETHLETLGLKKDALDRNSRGQLLEPARTYVQSWERSMRTATKPGTNIRYTADDVAKLSGNLVDHATVKWWRKAASKPPEAPSGGAATSGAGTASKTRAAEAPVRVPIREKLDQGRTRLTWPNPDPDATPDDDVPISSGASDASMGGSARRE